MILANKVPAKILLKVNIFIHFFIMNRKCVILWVPILKLCCPNVSVIKLSVNLNWTIGYRNKYIILKHLDKPQSKHECIPLDCVPLASVAATRCQSRGVGRVYCTPASWEHPSPHLDVVLEEAS